MLKPRYIVYFCFLVKIWSIYKFLSSDRMRSESLGKRCKARIEKKKKEKEFFAPVECKDEDELIRMQTLFPGKYPSKELLISRVLV